MDSLRAQPVVKNLLAHLKVNRFAAYPSKRIDACLLAETVLVTVAALAGLRLVSLNPVLPVTWLAGPAVLVVAALMPAILKRSGLPALGLNKGQVRVSLRLVGLLSLTLLPLMFAVLWAMKLSGLYLPVQPAGHKLPGWLFYQFMYVAVAEEVFFRGYLQNSILRLTDAGQDVRCGYRQWLAVTLSAGCFAAAHLLVRGEMTALLVFFPGLVFGWLYLRTRALLAPILFHGIANTFYLTAASVLA
jgi:membrane protease YdiL (CAAX protease family)